MMNAQVVFPFAHRTLGRVSRGTIAHPTLAPRIAQATVRVPDPRHMPLAMKFPPGRPQIFVHEGARQTLERRLSQAKKQPVILSITDNTRHMIALTQDQGILRARIHHMFLDASARIQEALVQFIATSDSESSMLIGKFIEEHAYRIRASRPVMRPVVTQGKHHDLLTIFQEINEKYFGGTVDALITWGRRTDQKRRTIKLGSYSAMERLIRIHPALDKAWVPRYFVSFIVYHEMLHHVIPSTNLHGRRSLHPPIFKERETLFRHYDRALAWEKTHLHRLLRSA